MTKVYTASKLWHWPAWLRIAREWTEVTFTAHWPGHVRDGITEVPENAVEFWVEDLADVARSDVVLVYAEPGDHLRGALVEAGMGLALGKRVIVVGEHDDYGTWQYHPLVTRVANLAEARAFL